MCLKAASEHHPCYFLAVCCFAQCISSVMHCRMLPLPTTSRHLTVCALFKSLLMCALYLTSLPRTTANFHSSASSCCVSGPPCATHISFCVTCIHAAPKTRKTCRGLHLCACYCLQPAVQLSPLSCALDSHVLIISWDKVHSLSFAGSLC